MSTETDQEHTAQQWEYVVKEVDDTLSFGNKIKIGGVKFDTLQEFLSEMGSSGWELCGTDSRNIQFIFKRPKQ